MATKYSGRGYITLADLDDFDTRLTSIENLIGSIDAQVSGSSDLMYYNSGGSISTTAKALSLTQTAIDAVRVPLNLADNKNYTHTFAAPFIEIPVVTATCDTKNGYASYSCAVVDVTTTYVTIHVEKVNTATAVKTGEGLHIIAVGKTAA